MPGSERSLEKRGYLLSKDTGNKDFLVCRSGVLHLYEDTRDGRRALVSSILLAYRCDVSHVKAENVIKIHTHVPFEAEYTFKPESLSEGEAWIDALLETRNHFQKIGEEYLQFLETGCTAHKYNYSNSKRMRRHFWIDEARVELCWGKSRADEPQNMDLRDCVGIIYGPMTTTFQRSNALEDPSWCCFSLLFPDRTLDLAVPDAHIQQWFLGLQHLLLTRSGVCISTLSEPQFLFRKVFHKLRDSARRQGFTTRALLVRNLHNLGRDRSFREGLKQQANGTAKTSLSTSKAASSSADAEAEAKAERRRRKRESKAEEAGGSVSASPPPGKDKKKSSAGLDRRKSTEVGGSNGISAQAAEQQEEELRRLIAQYQAQVETQTSQLEALRPKWNAQLGTVLPMDSLQDMLRSEDSLRWQFEKCAELEHEVLTLQGANNSMSGHLHAAEKAEKQLKKLAKQFKDSEAQCASMEQELGSAQAGAQSSEKAKYNSSASLERTAAQTSHLDKRVRELEQQLSEASKGQELSSMFQAKNKQQKEELTKIQNDKAQINSKIDALAKDHKACDKRHQENQQRLAATQGLSKNLLKALHKMQEDVKTLQGTHKAQIRSEADSQLRAIADSMAPLKGAVEKIGGQHEHLVERHREIMVEIKKLHNQVLELKGNIRVFVRVRPMNSKEQGGEPANGEVTITFAEEMKMSVYAEEQARRKWFDFDKVFRQNSTQTEVFEEVKPLATSVLDGYNVCIFAYGQTGSGKTFTMTGNPSNPGLNVRVLTELFRIRTERIVSVDCKLTISVSEIYNEQIKDLLGGQKGKKLDVKQNSDGTNSVPGLTELQVTSVEEVLKTMETAASNRTVMSTDMNDESSRSHSIVQVKTVCVHHKDKSTYSGKINLIDLAGSENTNKSGVSGQGMKEAQNINKSLSALGDVISSLVSKSGHIPYRNSKLTMMLKDSLGGDSKTLMIVQCSPAQGNVTETLSSLNFASRARNVELGKAKKNVSKSD